MNDSPADLQKKFDSLPEAIKDAITSVDFATKLQTIGKNHGLHLDELDSLFEEVGFVMLGETKPQDFKNKLAKRLSLTEAKVSPLVQSLDAEILRPIKISLVESAAKPPPAPPMSRPAAISTPPNPPKAAMPAPNKPPIVESPVLPHESDYNMSREAILSAIENPVAAEVRSEYTPHRAPEPTDPKEYLQKRQGLAALLEKAGVSPTVKKKSLSEEAVMMAKKKITGAPAAATPAISSATPPVAPAATAIKMAISPTAPQKPAPAFAAPKAPPVIPAHPPAPAAPKFVPVPKVGIASAPPPKPSDKLSGVVQIPSSKIEVSKTLPSTLSGVAGDKKSDPYREPF